MTPVPPRKPAEYRFQIFSVTEEKPTWPLVVYQGALLRMDVCLWEEPPSRELLASVPARVESVIRHADVFAATTRGRVAVVMFPLFGGTPVVGYIATPGFICPDMADTADAFLASVERGPLAVS